VLHGKVTIVDGTHVTLEERMTWLEARAGKDDEMIRALRDAVTVNVQMEAANSRALKDHAEWLVAHDQALIRSREEMIRSREEMIRSREEFDRRMQAHDRRMQALDERIEKLVSGIGEFIRREAK